MGKDMTDLEKFKQLFDEVGQEYDAGPLPNRRGMAEGAVHTLELPLSKGYPGFWAEFLFSADGKYAGYAAWE